jgi:energy-coupling factor transporter ATP-binding protein EcfA2
MSDTANSLLHRDIKEPYPGLRPFLDHEHDLLMGRSEQIEQVIERLRETHFVAIIGGSGSGKSSLIRAGVVPRLRAYAIPDAGDYWVPVVFTPGTTKADLQPSQEVVPDVQTPVTRLAWKFAQVMQPSKQDGRVDLALRDEVAAYIRQEAGLSRLVNAYHHLLPRPGPRTEKARFLFVIDQFEELFHPNNRENPDTRVIIEALIDHFHKPDPRAYVVMTMRSEHLADCAAYLNLPDAINRSFYLVRRLSNSELRSVITEPAQVMQRMVQRRDPTRTATVEFQPPVVARLLADTRRIEDDPDHLPLLQHLLARVWSAALTREQRSPTGDVPTTVTMADLEAAVEPWPGDREPGWLAGDRKLSTLRSSLENWAEHIYLRKRNADQQARIDELLAKLAYKDPNNGLYFQQRVEVDDPHLLQGVPAPKDVLWDLLKDGLVDTVNYLFWDDENCDHITLKVSHEAFIRGWPRFRRVADREAERFEEFVAVLRRCAAWHDGKADDALLLESAEIERIRRDKLLPVFAEAGQRRDWFAVLRLYREGERLVRLEELVQPFIDSSMARQQRLQAEAKAQDLKIKLAEEATRKAEEDKRVAQARHQADAAAAEAKQRQIEAEAARFKAESERNQARADQETAEAQRVRIGAEAERAKVEAERIQGRAVQEAAKAKQLQWETEVRRSRTVKKALWTVAAVASVSLAFVVHTWLFKSPAIKSIDKFVESQRDFASRPRSAFSRTEHAATIEIRALAEAIEKTLDAQEVGPLLKGMWTARDLREWTLTCPLLCPWLGRILGAADLQRLVDSASSEPLLNREMRRLLTTAVWEGGAMDVQPHNAPVLQALTCDVDWGGGPGGPSQQLKGKYLSGPAPGLGLFVPNLEESPTQMAVFSAWKLPGDQGCRAKFTFSVPASIKPSFYFDAKASAMAVVAQDQDVTLYDVEWNWNDRQSDWMAALALRRVLTDPRSSEAFKGHVPAPGTPSALNPVHVLETRPVPGGVEVKLGSAWWRLLSSEARQLPTTTPVSEVGWQRLVTPTVDTTCAVLTGWVKEWTETQLQASDASRGKPEATVDVMDVPGGRHCVSITRVDNSGGGSGSSSLSANEVVSVAIYHALAVDAERAGGSNRLPAPVAEWRFDSQAKGTRRDWWVGKPGTDWDGWLAATPERSTNQAVASPYSTAALKRLADGIVAASPLSKSKSGSTERAAVQPYSKP